MPVLNPQSLFHSLSIHSLANMKLSLIPLTLVSAVLAQNTTDIISDPPGASTTIDSSTESPGASTPVELLESSTLPTSSTVDSTPVASVVSSTQSPSATVDSTPVDASTPAPTPTSTTTPSPPTAEELSQLDATIAGLQDTLDTLLAEVSDSPELQQLVADVSASLDSVMSRLAELQATTAAKRHIMMWIAKRDTASDLIDDVVTLLDQLRAVVAIIEPIENKSDALQANLDSVLNTIAELEAWLEAVNAEDEVASSSSAGDIPATSGNVPATSGDASASATASGDAPASSGAAVSGDASASVSPIAANTTAESTTLTTTQTVTHCENSACSNTVVTLTTCVPVIHTVTTCPTVIEGKTLTVVVPCEIETEYVHADPTVAGEPKIKTKTISGYKVVETIKPIKSDSPDILPIPVETVETHLTTKTLVSSGLTTTITGTILVTRVLETPLAPTQANFTSVVAVPSTVAQANSGDKLAIGALALLPLLLM